MIKPWYKQSETYLIAGTIIGTIVVGVQASSEAEIVMNSPIASSVIDVITTFLVGLQAVAYAVNRAMQKASASKVPAVQQNVSTDTLNVDQTPTHPVN